MWFHSLETVQAKNPAAADLLRLCAFCAPDAIAEEILTADPEVLGPVLAPLGRDTPQRNQAIEILQTYSLIQYDPIEKTLSMHREVQTVLREMLEEAEQQVWVQRVVAAINAAFPWPEYAKWKQCERMLAQALAATNLIEVYRIGTWQAGCLLNALARYLSDRVEYTQAEPLFQQAVRIWEASLGPKHPAVASALNNLANLYQRQGRFKQAERLYQRALRIREISLGSRHPQVAVVLNNLANLYREQDRSGQSEPLYQRAGRIWEVSLGRNHPQVASALNNLAMMYREQGKNEKAEPLF